MINIDYSIKQITEIGYEFLQLFRGQSGRCFLIISKRFDADWGERKCRWLIALTEKLWDEEEIRFRICITRTALADARIKKLEKNNEQFLLETGLIRFKKILLENDTLGKTYEFEINSRSPETDFDIDDTEEIYKELDRVGYEFLDHLWKIKYKGVEALSIEEIEAKICTDSKIFDAVREKYVYKKFVEISSSPLTLRITPIGDEQLDKLRSQFKEERMKKAPYSYKNGKDENYDIFICHASEDKDEFVRPLAEGLRARGIKVWYDEFSLKIGDSLRESIDNGLANSSHGVVVISHDFFKKRWPQKELNGLFSKMESDKKVILPIWHNTSAEEIGAHSPLLADIIAARSSDGMDEVISSIIAALK